MATRPETISRSDCRGDARKSSEPNREMSCRGPTAPIISMAQQARPNSAGQIALDRPQLITLSRVVVRTLSPRAFSGVGPAARPVWKGPGEASASPFERSLAPGVDQGHQQDGGEHRHLDDAEPAQSLDDHGPGVDEDGLDVEDDEEHGRQVKADGKAAACTSARHDAGLVGQILRCGSPAARQPGRKEEGDESENQDRSKKNEQGKIIAQHGMRLSLTKRFLNTDRRSEPIASNQVNALW